MGDSFIASKRNSFVTKLGSRRKLSRKVSRKVSRSKAGWFQQIARRASIEKSLKYRKHSIFSSDDMRSTIYGPLLCLTIGITVGVLDGGMVQFIHLLYDTKIKILQWAVDNFEIQIVLLPLLGYSLALTLFAVCLVQ
jgi:hypothetical protein